MHVLVISMAVSRTVAMLDVVEWVFLFKALNLCKGSFMLAYQKHDQK